MREIFVRLTACGLVGAMCLPGVAQTGVTRMKRAKAGRVVAESKLSREVEALLADPKVMRAHWGVYVTGLDGAPIYGRNEGQYFQPASNAKLFTTAAAMALLGGSATFETKVVGSGVWTGTENLKGDLVLVGGGDANLSGRTIPYVSPKDMPKLPPPAAPALRYLEELADQVVKSGLKVVNGDVVGDDTLFPWEPYPEDWTIDDTVWGYGAPVSALTVNDNQLVVKVAPADVAGKPAVVTIDPSVPYYTVQLEAMTGAAKSGSHVQMERQLGSKVLRIYGSIGVDASPDVEEVAIHDPAGYAAMALKVLLEARGVLVTGVARAKHVAAVETRGFVEVTHEPVAQMAQSGTGYFAHGKGLTSTGCDHCDSRILPKEVVLASRASVTVAEDVAVTNKVSQNLHAELLLHQLAVTLGSDGSTLQGARVVRSFLTTRVGVDADDYAFFDGSGLSGHDLVTPRATARLLQYAAMDPKTKTAQPWFADWKKSLPVGGEDGSLAGRFPKAPLSGHVFAKTGTLGEARALSGYMECASGKTVVFSIMVGNHAPRSSADRDAMDRIVVAIAASN